MATFEGEPYLEAQLGSIATQRQVDWQLIASDDGSADGTVDRLKTFQERHGPDRVTILRGPGHGPLENFLSLLERDDEGDAWAFADQDDVWESDKLRRATAWLATVPADVPALYTSRTQLIDHAGRPGELSPLFRRPPSFANALAQNLASGNTMVFNRAARQLLRRTAVAARDAVMHDWWAYLVVTGSGGEVRYDPTPTVSYRQHAANEVGTTMKPLERAARGFALLRGQWRRWTDQNLRALEKVKGELAPAAAATLDAFSAARQRSIGPRLLGLWRSGVYRQTRRGTLWLWASACVNRL